MNINYTGIIETPLGIMRIMATERGISEIEFTEQKQQPSKDVPDFLRMCAEQLREYFGGVRTSFDSFPLVITGTDFQCDVWKQAESVPYGETWTYGSIAKALEMDGGGQAVGSALGRNKLCIVIPCHRIVPASGEVGGYAGGAWRKEWLLKHEKEYQSI